MTAVSDEPALRFWLRYAEREGALVEQAGDQALALLPPPLQAASELPEEVIVTADPDVAREDGAVLLIAGHPALERAAAVVLGEGDTGHVYLPWPRSRPPARSTLEARARALVPVEHGRIDAAGEPAPAYVPLLRVGAMISYSASLALRFGEQEEVWADARTGLVPGERMLAALRDAPRLPQPDQRHRTLPAGLSLALPSAHDQLERRASVRQTSLAVHVRRALESELGRADAYYRSALESIERRRRSAAAGDRLRLLDAQADATRAEHARRKREIEHEYRARHEIKPFRLHLVHVPALVLPVHVRRGSRTFPFALTWLAMSGEFAPFRCPACGAAEPLVAARDGLGCESCNRSRSAGGPASSQTDAVELERPRERDRPAPQVARAIDDASAKRRPPAGSRPGSTAPRRTGRPAGRPLRRPPARPGSRGTVERTGNKLALAFWQRIARGDRWPPKKAARDSPLRALHRLYGQPGPLCALGIPPGEWPDEVTASTYPTEPGTPELTAGGVLAGGLGYRYSLYWRLQAGTPVVFEVMPAPHPLALPPAQGETTEIGARLRGSAPAPTVELDPVASALWRAELERNGLPFVVRCLATWWRIQDDADTGEPHGAIAATVAGAVAGAAGMRRSKAETVATYEVDVASVAQAAAALGGSLRLDRAHGW